MLEKLITVSQAARVKNVSRQAVYGAIERNELRNLNSEGPPVLRETDVLKWIPQKAGGSRNTAPMTEKAKAKLSETQKRRWFERKRSS